MHLMKRRREPTRSDGVRGRVLVGDGGGSWNWLKGKKKNLPNRGISHGAVAVEHSKPHRRELSAASYLMTTEVISVQPEGGIVSSFLVFHADGRKIKRRHERIRNVMLVNIADPEGPARAAKDGRQGERGKRRSGWLIVLTHSYLQVWSYRRVLREGVSGHMGRVF